MHRGVLIPESVKKKHLVMMTMECNLLGKNPAGITVCVCLPTSLKNISEQLDLLLFQVILKYLL